jgi:hypothetical protein
MPEGRGRGPMNEEVIQQMHSHYIAALVRIDAVRAEITTS